MCTTAPGLQRIIDQCTEYVKLWRFNFGLKKTKCIVSCGQKLLEEPRWYLDGNVTENVPSLEILGINFGAADEVHVNSRIDKCRRSFCI